MSRYRIKARHEVLCDYIIEADSEVEAVNRLCLAECQLPEYSRGEFWVIFEIFRLKVLKGTPLLECRGIEVDFDSIEISDACATKTNRMPSWDVEAEEEEECDVE